MLKVVLLVAVAAVLRPASADGQEKPPRFVINLDAPPEVRYKEVAEHFKEIGRVIPIFFNKSMPNEVFQLSSLFSSKLSAEYLREIDGFAKLWNCDSKYVLLANLMYDITTACTSIVMQDNNGTIFHGRNLDYAFPDILRNATYIGDFQRGGKTSFVVTTYASYFGVLSGMRPNAFTISADQRAVGAVWENVASAMLINTSRPLGFLVREMLDTPGMDFVKAVERLSTTTLIAPVYFIVGGTEPGQGAVITRNQFFDVDTMYLDPSAGRWYVLETNYDHWKPAPHGDDRRDPALKMLNTSGRKMAGFGLLKSVLTTHPMLNRFSTYTCLMSAAHPETFTAWVDRVSA